MQAGSHGWVAPMAIRRRSSMLRGLHPHHRPTTAPPHALAPTLPTPATPLAPNGNMLRAVYGLGSGLFFLGYSVFMIPSNILMLKVGTHLGARWWRGGDPAPFGDVGCGREELLPVAFLPASCAPCTAHRTQPIQPPHPPSRPMPAIRPACFTSSPPALCVTAAWRVRRGAGRSAQCFPCQEPRPSAVTHACMHAVWRRAVAGAAGRAVGRGGRVILHAVVRHAILLAAPAAGGGGGGRLPGDLVRAANLAVQAASSGGQAGGQGVPQAPAAPAAPLHACLLCSPCMHQRLGAGPSSGHPMPPAPPACLPARPKRSWKHGRRSFLRHSPSISLRGTTAWAWPTCGNPLMSMYLYRGLIGIGRYLYRGLIGRYLYRGLIGTYIGAL